MAKPITYCSVDECGARCFGHGYCNRHYKRWRKHGDPLGRATREYELPCTVEGCTSRRWSAGWCPKHHTRARRYGDPLARLPGESARGCYVCASCRQDRPASEFSRPGKSSCRECVARRRAIKAVLDRLDWPCECAGCGSPFFGTRITRYCSPACRKLNDDHNSRRKARLLKAPSERIDRLQVFIRDGWVCGLCSLLIDPSAAWPDPQSASLDHKVPLARGGSHILANVQAAHLHCNLSKGAREQVSA